MYTSSLLHTFAAEWRHLVLKSRNAPHGTVSKMRLGRLPDNAADDKNEEIWSGFLTARLDADVASEFGKAVGLPLAPDGDR